MSTGGVPLTHVSHTATFTPADMPARILEDLACPACGYHDPRHADRPISNNQIRIFCDSCGVFITIALSDEQARAIHRASVEGDRLPVK
jgi:hypothetical protein